jgi:hypothetical protein
MRLSFKTCTSMNICFSYLSPENEIITIKLNTSRHGKKHVSSAMYSDQKEREKVSCGFCGKALKGFYFTCHVCGAAYCYAHRPEKCTHRRMQQVELKA